MVRGIHLGWPWRRRAPTLPSGVMQPPDGWTAHARPVLSFTCDAVFPVSSGLYTGPSDGFTLAQWHDLRVPVPPPDVNLLDGRYFTASDALTAPGDIAAYYQRLIGLARQHGVARTLDGAFPLFAVEPAVIADGAIQTSFAWYEGAAFTREVFAALAESTGDGVIWNGMDQGWAGQFEARGNRICFVDWDPDGQGDFPPGISLDRNSLVAQAADALDRFQQVHAALVTALGHDYWR